MESKEQISKEIKQKPTNSFMVSKKKKKERKYVGGPGSLWMKET